MSRARHSPQEKRPRAKAEVDPLETELWTLLAAVADEWVAVARTSYDERELGVARALAALRLGRATRARSAIKKLSVWARQHLDPSDVSASTQTRGALARHALESVILVLRNQPGVDPLARVAMSQEREDDPDTVVPHVQFLAADERREISREWSGGNERYRRLAQVVVTHAHSDAASIDELWSTRVPFVLLLWASKLVPREIPLGNALIGSLVRARLSGVSRTAIGEIESALQAIRNALMEQEVQAPEEVRYEIARAVALVMRRRVDEIEPTDKVSREHIQARVLLSETLRAWGVRPQMIENLWRTDQTRPTPDPPAGRRPPSHLAAFPMGEAHQGARRLYYLTTRWIPASDHLGKHLASVLDVLKALTVAWIAEDTRALQAAGSLALTTLKNSRATPSVLLDARTRSERMRDNFTPLVRVLLERIASEKLLHSEREMILERAEEEIVAKAESMVSEMFPIPPNGRDTRERLVVGVARVLGRAVEVVSMRPGPSVAGRERAGRAVIEVSSQITRAVLRAIDVPERLVKNLFQDDG